MNFKNLLPLLAIATLCGGCCSNNGNEQPLIQSINTTGDQLYLHVNGLEKSFTAAFLSDTHYTIEDERGAEYYKYSKRMGGEAAKPENYGKGNGRDKFLLQTLEKARKADAKLVILGGDIINYPSLASVERLRQIMDESGLKWTYIAGNHDWHYEGEAGTDMEQRDKWTRTNLEPLYQGENPLYAAQVINGVNFVTIDNSLSEITDEQLRFMEEQIGKGYPVVVACHVPPYLPGHDIFYTCGNPDWNAANDPLYELERRQPWAEEGFRPTTYKFRDLILRSPKVIAILAGHTHRHSVDYINNRIVYVTGANFEGSDVILHFVPAE